MLQDIGEIVVSVYLLVAIGWFTYEYWRDHDK